MAAARWLRRSGVTPRVFVGVRKQDCALKHAYKCGDVTVTGAHSQDFTILAGPNAMGSRSRHMMTEASNNETNASGEL